MRVAFVEWPDGLSASGEQWDWLRDSVCAARPDILITNELPFGPWLAETAFFSEDEAHHSIRAHERGLEGLMDLEFDAANRVAARIDW